jgi:hypothetical protein
MAGLALAVAGLASAQQTNYPELARLSKQFTARSFAAKADAKMRALKYGLPIRADQNGVTIEIMKFVGNQPIYYVTDNVNAAKTNGMFRLWPGGSTNLNLSGAGATLSEWDAGSARVTHQEFGGRVINKDGVGTHYHSTHVAGTMVASGVDAAAKGMSFSANLDSFDWDNDIGEMAAEAATGVQISNHSYGLITGWLSSGGNWYWYGNPAVSATEDFNFGIYDADSRDWDVVCNNAPYFLPFKSAGNDRNQGPSSQPTGFYWNGSAWVPNTVARLLDGGPNGYDCLGNVAVAKNNMVIAAVDDVPGGWSQPSDVVMSSFSSWGPTDDGRIKPDLSANGVNLYSTWDTADNAYGTISGTSMATPSAAGAAGAIARYYETSHGSKMLSSTLRGLLIHAADEAGANPGPDYAFGWGLMDAATAGLIIKDDLTAPKTIQETALSNGETINMTYSSNGTMPLKVTICWNDPAGTPSANVLDDPSIKLVNDLDVRVTKGATTYMPWVLNPAAPAAAATTGDNIRDNVEVIEIPAPAAGDYTVTITHKGALAADQMVSVIVTGSTTVTLPTVQSLTLLPTTVKGGSPSTATVTLSGAAPTGGSVVTLSSNNAAGVVPATVTVPATQTSVNFVVNTKRVSSSQTATITASYNATNATADLTIRPPHVKSLVIAPNPQNGGSVAVGTVEIDVTAPTGGMPVALSTTNSATASLPASVIVPAGATTANFNIDCGLVAVTSSATITATIETTQKSVSLQVLASLVKYEVKSIIPSGASITSGNLNSLKLSDNGYLVWQPLNLNMKFIALDMLGTAEANLKSLNFTVEIKGDAMVDYKVEAFNYTKNSWVTIGNIPATTTDTSMTFSIGSPNSFVNTTNKQIRSRVTAGPHKGAPATWTSSIDQAIWTAQK